MVTIWFAVMGAQAGPLSDLAFLAGCWETPAGAEECWLPPRHGLMVGVHRSGREGRAPFFEYLRIERDGDVVHYVASPRGQATTVFRQVQQGEEWVVFENPTHDFPTRIRYERVGDELTATISGVRSGAPASTSWTFRRTGTLAGP